MKKKEEENEENEKNETNDPTSFISQYSTSSFIPFNELPTKLSEMDISNMPDYPHAIYSRDMTPVSLLLRTGYRISYQHEENITTVTIVFTGNQGGTKKVSTKVSPILGETERKNLVALKALRQFNLFQYLINKEIATKTKITKALNNSKTVQIFNAEKLAEAESEQKIDTSSFATKMMLKMGWTPGTALAAGGLVVPIAVKENNAKRGLGREIANKDFDAKQFKESALSLMREFLDSTEFTMSIPSLPPHQRAEVHKIARQRRLATKSYTRDGERVIVISRRGTEEEWNEKLKNEEIKHEAKEEERREIDGKRGGTEVQFNYPGGKKKSSSGWRRKKQTNRSKTKKYSSK